MGTLPARPSDTGPAHISVVTPPPLPAPRGRALGQRMETLACRYLERHGLQLRTRNHHARYGELDLVMTDRDTCVFVEVRYRQHSQHGSPFDSVTPRKQQRLILAAQHYLMQHALDMPCRFDIIGLSGTVQAPDITWMRHAFDAC
ncbi:predicted endonuclease [Zymobacter palmae]|uniref:UPF0102 protein ZBT109_0891 n=1 Tax=Zymobacter palmae TaxID=33074 RepID=A0A348HDG2_9GAMM|nr:predicted endonuclease [Zymobacter palmae]